MTGLEHTPAAPGTRAAASASALPRVLLLYHRNATTTAAYLEAALRRAARVTTVGDGQEVHVPREATVPLPDLLGALGERVDLVLEVEGENVRAAGHRDAGVPCAWWAIDSHLHTSYDRHFFDAKRYDHVFVAQKHHVVRYQDWAWVPASWLPLAADPDVFRPAGGPLAYDVGFVGSVLPGLHEARQRLLVHLLERFERVLVARGAFRDDAARELSSCCAVFNRSLHEDVNMRVFEAMACGRPLVTDRLPAKCGLEELAVDGEHLVLYDDADLEVTLARLLADEGAPDRLGAAGRALVLGRHTYDHRARRILEAMGVSPGGVSPGGATAPSTGRACHAGLEGVP